MKVLILLLALALPVAAETDLEKLRAGWKEARERALDPVDRKYLAALKVLKDRLTREGNLEDALKVENEIKTVAGRAVGGFKGRVTPEMLVIGEWRFDVRAPAYTTHLRFTAEKLVFERGKKDAIGRWEIKGNKLRTEFRKTWNEFEVEFDGEPVLVEKRFDGGKREGATLTLASKE